MKPRIKFYILCFIFILSSTLVVPVQAKRVIHSLPELDTFVESVINGDANTLRGVYVYGLMAQPVIQQPREDAGFISLDNEQLTQFNMASQFGSVGLLAHNYLAGNAFSQLKNDDLIWLVYGDGRKESFAVTKILEYQALDPNSPYSDFRDLQTQSTLSAREVFNNVYRGERHVTFQTCIEANGNLSWGRLFVIAEPVAVDTLPFIDSIYSATNFWKN